MRKKLLCAILASVMALSLAACGGNGDKNDSNGESATQTATQAKPEIESSAALLNSVWEKFDDASKFPVMGGDFENAVSDQAGLFNIADVENIETISDYNLLKKAISSLSEKEQEILYLRCIMNMSFREIGNILNIKEGTARQRMSDARNSLMKKIKGEDYV